MTTKTVNNVQCLYFSPTGSTRQIVETVAKGMGIPVTAPISITTPRERDSFGGQVDGDVLGRRKKINPPLGNMEIGKIL